jgi:NAD+ diphosphatase
MDHPRFLRSAASDGVAPDAARWFLFVQDRLVLVKEDNRLQIPDTATLARLELHPHRASLLGYLDMTPCFVGELTQPDLLLPLQLIDLREAHGVIAEHDYGVAGYAAQILHWDRTSQFCPVCATPTEQVPDDRAKRCPTCTFLQYPRISPAIIVLVYRDGQVLLTRKSTWPRNRYSLIAGFVEPGESLEACVQREVAEEAGIRVATIRYLGSQPWPFPHQLMIGFLAQYAGGELVIDTSELEHAAWFDLHVLPDLPPPHSIARQILEWYRAAQQDPTRAFPVDPYAV